MFSFSSIINPVRTLFGAAAKAKKAEPIDLPIEIKNIKPKVIIYDGLIDGDFIKAHAHEHVFIFAGNLEGKGGRFGQAVALRQGQVIAPDAVVELPVAKRAITSLDMKQIKDNAMTEGDPEELKANLEAMSRALDEAITKAYKNGRSIVVLQGGYGTSGSRLYELAPKTFAGLNDLLEQKLGVRQIITDRQEYRICPCTEEIPKTPQAGQKLPTNLWDSKNIFMFEGHNIRERLHRPVRSNQAA